MKREGEEEEEKGMERGSETRNGERERGKGNEEGRKGNCKETLVPADSLVFYWDMNRGHIYHIVIFSLAKNTMDQRKHI